MKTTCTKLFLSASTILLSGFLGMQSANAERVNRALAVPDAGGIKVDLNFEISLAEGAFFDPIALAPDFFYGINNDFAIGLVHSAASQGTFGVGQSIRIKGGNAYTGSGLEGFYTFLRGDTLDLAAQVGIGIDALDPDALLSLKAGAIGRTTLGPLEVTINPYIRLPLNKSEGRENIIMVPVWAYYNINSDIDFALITGLNNKALQLGAGVSYNLPGPVDLGAHIGWPRIAGDNSSAKAMATTLFASMEL